MFGFGLGLGFGLGTEEALHRATGLLTYLLWPAYDATHPTHQVAFLDCYTMRFVPPPDAAAANTSALPPLPLQYSLGAEKVCSCKV